MAYLKNHHPEPLVLEVAVQTALYKNKTRLSSLAEEQNCWKLAHIAREITQRALELQAITDAVVKEMDSLHLHEVRYGDVKQ